MPLDPHLAGVLQMLAQAGGKPTHESTPEEARAAYLKLTAGSLTPEQRVAVGAVEDTQVDGAAGPLPARIYRPDSPGPHPTVAYFHGGGYVIGNLDTHDNMCRHLCRGADAVIVSVDYRLAPEHPFPAGVDDAVAATRWVLAHAQELGGNPTVGIAGDSAGGNFAAVVSQQLRDSAATPLAAQLLIYPAVDHAQAHYPSMDENATGYFLEAQTMAWFFNHYASGHDQPLDPRLAPLQASSLAGLPPALVLTAEFDPLRDSGMAYAQALQAAGVPTQHLPGPGMVHGYYDMGRWSPAAQALVDESARRFGQMLRGQ